jgi:hypothetical protein
MSLKVLKVAPENPKPRTETRFPSPITVSKRGRNEPKRCWSKER